MRHSRTLAFLFGFFSLTNLCLAQQQAPRIEWQRCLGGSGTEDSNPNLLQCIVQTFDGGYVIAGSTNSTDGDVSGLHDSSNGDMWVVKLSSSGAIQWQRCLGGRGNSISYSVAFSI